MDLIYADKNRIDLGVMKDYKFDLAYGSEENNFQLDVLLENNPCKEDYILYIEGTEYGGIIDSVAPDPSKNKLSYMGRTWHGVLNSKVLAPDPGYDYLTVDGDLNVVLAELIERMYLQELFIVSDEISGVDIRDYQFRYALGYEGIMKMLESVNAKLLMKWEDGMVHLWCEMVNNYSVDEEFDSSQFSFSSKKNFNLCNHIICLGKGDLKDRYAIHVFTDENGGVQPFSYVDMPMQDSDYILDQRNQVLFGNEEITTVYDYSNSEDTVNYLLLSSKPSDWSTNYSNYYQIENDDYTEIPKNIQDWYEPQKIKPYDWGSKYKDYYFYNGDSYEKVESSSTYVALSSKPSDWSTNWKDYYRLDGTSYKGVDGVVEQHYICQTKRPSDWSTNYANYYVTNGIDWSACSGDSVTIYNLQTRKPSDWSTNWKDYYCIYLTGDYIKCGGISLYKKKRPKWRKNTFFNQGSKTVAPKWKKAVRYTKKETTVAPTFVAGTFYRLNEVPAWQANTYYTLHKDYDMGVQFNSSSYYQQVIDHYATLVSGAIEKFAECYASDELNVSFDANRQYDIGDIVGAYENFTEIFVAQPITKKIVTIEKNNETIEYEVKKNGS